MEYLNVALPKGRIGNLTAEMFTKLGFKGLDEIGHTRKLILEDEKNKIRFFLVKPSDVTTYVEYGSADIGVVGKDVILEENRNLYGKGDLGEVYAISLAQTIGAYALVTDDTKQGGPYMSLLQLDYDIMPFTFSDILILRYLLGNADEFQTMEDFERINRLSDLNWSFKSQIIKFIKRFWKEPYKKKRSSGLTAL